MAAVGSLKEGDAVTCVNNIKNWDGDKLNKSVFTKGKIFYVCKSSTTKQFQLGGKKVAISTIKGASIVSGKVTAWVNIKDLTKVEKSSTTSNTNNTSNTSNNSNTSTKTTTATPATNADSNALTGKQIDEYMTKLGTYASSANELKYSMRLFGLPHQFTEFCDYRTYYNSGNGNTRLKVGRKFIDNIMLEAPVVTIVPGKPLYLPAAKNKKSVSYSLISAANNNLSSLVLNSSIAKDQNLTSKLRYYDFQNDYYTYMKYVNILCSVGASFLDISDVKFGGKTFATYDWKNYRWTADKYATATGNMIAATGSAVKNFTKTLEVYGKSLLNGFDAMLKTGNVSSLTEQFAGGSTTVSTDPDILSALEEIMTQVNYVQFYVSPDSTSVSESADNNTAASKLEGLMDSGADLFKEAAFIANSGGIDAAEISEMMAGATDVINDKLLGSSTGGIGGILSRVLSAGSNVIRGENMIFPQIYQSSNYSKNYTITVDLRAPYGNKVSYFLNILVPLFHLMALVLPKQTTANTYGSPFLIKCYYPGVFSCNLGIVKSLSIDKSSSGDSWTVDGYPNEVKVTLSIDDLYSDLTMTPSGADSIILFLSNSSLIEYIATNCGVNLTVPQLSNRLKMITNAIDIAFDSAWDNVAQGARNSIENWVSSLMGV